ncbi:DUF4396 domain-containing protein [Oryzobacter telluris]|uniref:DUF4396 domain-containing protein n=1 Tax=Oryzobacter telluris TaxID=3149179 RepID=UPI00370D39F6
MDHPSQASAEPATTHEHHHPSGAGTNAMAASATLHCLTGCAIGEIVGLVLGTALSMSNAATIALSIGLAFVFGYTLSTFPLLRAGLTVGTALKVVLAADTLSILTMEVVDNLVMATVPGAMSAGLVNAVFWAGMGLALGVAFVAAFPVNRYLLSRGKGHALVHEYHHSASSPIGVRRLIPSLGSALLATGVAAFLAGGLLVAVAAEDSSAPITSPAQHDSAPHR